MTVFYLKKRRKRRVVYKEKNSVISTFFIFVFSRRERRERYGATRINWIDNCNKATEYSNRAMSILI
jgi:hypothetical protein